MTCVYTQNNLKQLICYCRGASTTDGVEKRAVTIGEQVLLKGVGGKQKLLL